MRLLGKLISHAAGLLHEKPKVEIDYFGLEHFLLYHGLIGSTPENQREYKDVRADLLSAISRENSANLCANLKLEPLYWEEKLLRIIDEALAQPHGREQLRRALLPIPTNNHASNQPLNHEDWQVKANVALIISHLQLTEAQKDLIGALSHTAGDTTPAFCHVSRACSSFHNEEMKEALGQFLQHSQPWMQVDSAAALSTWPLAQAVTMLEKAFTYHHDFLDYAAIAVAKNHSPRELLKLESAPQRTLASQLIINIIEAGENTFAGNFELICQTGIHQCSRLLAQALENDANPTNYRAARQLLAWLHKKKEQLEETVVDYPCRESLTLLEAALTNQKPHLVSQLQAIFQSLPTTNQKKEPLEGSQARVLNTHRQAVILTGELQLKEFVPALLQILNQATENHLPDLLEEVIDSLAQTGETEHASSLVALARRVVNPQERANAPTKASPVQENSPRQAKVYWKLLIALGEFPTSESLALCLLGTQDLAADKREAALSSAINLYQRTRGQIAGAQEVKQALLKSLSDSSSQVKLVAARGAGQLTLRQAIPGLSKLITAQEASLNRAALEALGKIAAGGNDAKAEVKAALMDAKLSCKNALKERRIDEILSNLHC
jgi:hypothetical protein